MNSIDPATLRALPRHIGAERFAPYLAECGQDLARAARLYAWNIEASAAVLGAYAAIEVGVRNAIHDELTRHCGRPEWWNAVALTSLQRADVSSAEQYLDSKRGHRAWSPGHLVAELRSSFWEGLLANRFHAALWEPAIRQSFPHLIGRRIDLKNQLERVRLLRNRAAHHEPIYARDLLVDHRYMVQIASYISTDLELWVTSHSRLPGVVAGRRDTVDGRRATRF